MSSFAQKLSRQLLLFKSGVFPGKDYQVFESYNFGRQIFRSAVKHQAQDVVGSLPRLITSTLNSFLM